MIRIGVIGCGMAVQRLHFPALKRLRRGVAVVALASSNYERAKAFAAGVKIARVHATYEELLGDSEVDAVLVAVPIELNGRVLLDALHAGKHVMAEKPIAATLDEAHMIVREADGRSQVVLIAENFRYRLDLAQMRSFVDSGAIGDLLAFQLKVNFDVAAAARQPWISRDWRHDGRHAGGFVLDAGVHPIAALREVLGEVSEVYAQALNTSSLVHGADSLLMQVRMKSGVPGHCFFCYTAKEARENALDFAIFGTEGVTAHRSKVDYDHARARKEARISQDFGPLRRVLATVAELLCRDSWRGRNSIQCQKSLRRLGGDRCGLAFLGRRQAVLGQL